VATEDDFGSLGTLPGGDAVLGQAQFLPGYSLLFATRATAQRLSDLPRAERLLFLDSMDMLGEAVEIVCRRHDSRFRRINLEIEGNFVPQLHAHIWPRYEWEPAELLIRQVGRYPLERWHEPDSQLGPQHQQLRDDLRLEINRLIAAANA
jgi:diadenosine tetraphosphate (Ap4A) HIT family hydrolase